jgi:hypothetical protein
MRPPSFVAIFSIVLIAYTTPAFTQTPKPEAIARQATRCALHADLAASTERDVAAKAKWLRQKEALVLFSASVATSEQFLSWTNEFTDEIVAAKSPRQYSAVISRSTSVCQAFLAAHADELTAAYNKAHGNGG